MMYGNISVLILPMRNGNLLSIQICQRTQHRSYPTYEEWKPSFTSLFSFILHRSYPTYEEWKLFGDIGGLLFPSEFLSYLWGMETFSNLVRYFCYTRSYPTYEEWKLPIVSLKISISSVLILPMRNGNEGDIKESFQPGSGFLSYLWGMETWISRSSFLFLLRFLSYLWGMETIHISDII